MRLYIRNKQKYDPSDAGKPLVFVDFPDPRVFSVGQVKEEFKKKARAAKVDTLYHRRADGSYEVLADDRTIGFYNIQDNAILETTNNPLWAAAIYYRLREVEKDAATNQANDARAGRGLEQSCIQKYMALGILFNGGNNPEQQQTPYFEELDQLYEHLQTAGKKPVHMSQKTLDTLQALKDEYEQNDVHERDSIGHFVDRQAVKLGLTSKSNGNGNDQQSGKKGGGRAKGQEQRGQRQTGQGRGGRRAPQKQRTCEDCEENVGTQFCADCQPPLVLCDDCAVMLHRGATRRNHQLKDVSEAPAPARNKGYTPKAYRAPFAMLVAFHRAANEVPSKMSLTADELKPRAQPLTNTDLEIKQGRWFGGFDSLENALVKNELVQKEARTPKYSLLAKGQPLAARCSEFDYAVQNLTQAASVPTIPVMGARPVLRNRQVCLLVDSEEPLRERFVRVARQRGLSAKTRKLPVGDFLWVLLPPGVNPDTVRDMPDQELVLPMIVERKTWDDLWSSLKTTRFANQVQRMKRCGLQNLFYLVEGSAKDLKGNPGPEVETYLQDKIDSLLIDEQFLVNRTGSWLKTVEWLCHLTNMSIESRQSEGETSLMTYSEFSRSGKLKKLKRTILAVPVTSTVWSATEFIDALRSHSRGGNELHNLPVSRGEERSLIVIQGLTLYNKQCHKLLDKALADLLENTHQTAEACVQRHLHGVTDQLVHEDVSQWYILWLQVFKGVMVRRTESEEESAQVLCKFYQNTPGGVDAPPFNDGDVGVFIGASEENVQRLPEDDLVFANDSQEEDAMVRQALRTSEYEHKTSLSRDVTHSSIVKKPPSSTATKAPVATSSASRSQNHSIDTMNEREQLELAMELSRVENAAKESCNSTVKTPVKPFASQQHRAVSHTPVMPRTNMEVPKTTHTRTESPDDEFQEALQLSLEEFERAKPRQNHRADMAGTDHDLQRALELSKMEYEQFREDTVNHGKSGGVLVDRDTELEVLELSKLECEAKNLEQHQGDATLEFREAEVEQLRDKKRNLMITSQDQKGKDVDFSGDSDLQKALELSKVEYEQHVALDNKDVTKRRDSSNEDDLTKALLLSRLDCTKLKEDALGMAKAKLPTCNVDQAIDGGMANALELSKMECSGVHSCDANRERSRDGDLERALELSRIEYTQSTNSGPLDEKDKAPDVIVLEESCGLLPSRDQDLSHLNQSALSVDDDGYVPSSVPSDHGWDPESENQDNDVFDALNPVGITGNSKDSAILLDSQEPIDDTDHGWGHESDSLHDDVFGASHPVTITGKSKGSAILLDSQEPIDDTVDDFAYALKVQEELNKETIRGNSSHDDSLNKKHTVGPELNKQLITYREFQKKRYGVISGQRDKSSHGLDFRRNVAAIACGKPVQIGVASAISRSGNSEKRGELGRVLGDKPSCSSSISRVDRDKRSPCRDGVHIIRDDGPGLKMVGSPSSSCDKPFVSHPGTTSSPRPFSSSASSFERVHKRPSSTFSGPCSPRSAVASSPVSPSISSSTSTASQSRSSSDKPLGPKCGACGEIGHNKNSKMCPHYFSAEAVQRREEQSRKRKAKKEEEEREFNDRLGALAAQRLSMEEQSRIVGDQLDQLRRQSQNMADTQKKLEDAIKRKRKR